MEPHGVPLRLALAIPVHAEPRQLQILHGNTACSHVPRLLGKQVTAKAYSEARSRLALEVFQQLLVIVCGRLQACVNDTGRWLGHRVWVMDGTGCSMPDTPELQKAFGQPPMQRVGCGFPVAHLLAMFHVGTGMLVRVVAAPLRTGDMALAKYAGRNSQISLAPGSGTVVFAVFFRAQAGASMLC